MVENHGWGQPSRQSLPKMARSTSQVNPGQTGGKRVGGGEREPGCGFARVHSWVECPGWTTPEGVVRQAPVKLGSRDHRRLRHGYNPCLPSVPPPGPLLPTCSGHPTTLGSVEGPPPSGRTGGRGGEWGAQNPWGKTQGGSPAPGWADRAICFLICSTLDLHLSSR